MRTEIAEVLIDIEAQLRQLGLWDKIPPSTEALASTEPFCVDTLTLPQWLQFIFLPTIYRLLEEEQPLPGRCSIAPMAEEYFRGMSLASGALERALRLGDPPVLGRVQGGKLLLDLRTVLPEQEETLVLRLAEALAADA